MFYVFLFFFFSSRRRHTRSGLVFFFFKKKTAYEIMPSLVGSEMCIRDSQNGARRNLGPPLQQGVQVSTHICLLYTSDAADDLLCVALGGRRIINKKN